MDCPHCGEEIEDGSSFCPECLTLIDDDDSSTSSVETDSDDSKLSFSLPSVSRRLILLGVILLVAGGGVAGVVYSDAVSIDDIREVTSGLSDTTTNIVSDRVTTSANELVIQISQLGLGWETDEPGAGEILASYPIFVQDIPLDAETASFENEERGERLLSVVSVANSSEEATRTYDTYVENASREYGTENVDLGDGGLVYTEGGATVVVFRERNVFGVVGHTTGTNQPAVNQSIEFAELVTNNIESNTN